MSVRRFLPARCCSLSAAAARTDIRIVWFQLLQLVIGSSAVSWACLGTFMGGMCLGSLLPRFIGPDQHPLRVYATLELGIGLFGLLILFGMPLLGGVYFVLGGEGIVGILWRGVAAALCLAPPTLMMGATLPAMSRWVESTPEGVSWLGFFYGGNIAGGVIGCLTAGFYCCACTTSRLPPTCGQLNVLRAVLAIHREAGADGGACRPRTSGPGDQRAPGEWAVYVTIALCQA